MYRARKFLAALAMLVAATGVNITMAPGMAHAQEWCDDHPCQPLPPFEKTLSVDHQWQANNYYCGPAAGRHVLSAIAGRLNGPVPRQDQLAAEMGTTENGTSSIDVVVNVLNRHSPGPSAWSYLAEHISSGIDGNGNLSDRNAVNMLKQRIKTDINDGYALEANFYFYPSDRRPSHYPHGIEMGHYVAIIGYKNNGDTIVVHDSAFGQETWEDSIENIAYYINSKGYAW